MEISFDVKIFSLIYESGKYLLPFLFVLWLTWLFSVIILRKRKQFLLTSAAFLLFCLLSASFTWSGWHYRMKLYEQYAVTKQGDPGWQNGKKLTTSILCPLISAGNTIKMADAPGGGALLPSSSG